MRSQDNSLSAIRLITSAVALAGALLCGCADDGDCGPGDAPTDGMTLTVGSDVVQFDRWTSSPNNDCPEAGHPTSLTVDGIQAGGSFHVTFCLPRPDELGGSVDLSDDSLIQVITVSAEINGCTVSKDAQATPSGSATFTGYCGDGSSSAGYALELAGSVSGTQTCNMTDTPVTIELGGRFAVEALMP